MKTIITQIGIAILLFAGHKLCIGQTNPFPLSLISVDIIYLRTDHYSSYPTKIQNRNMPCVVSNILRASDIYQITLTLQVKGINSVYSDPFVIRIIDKNGKRIDLILNRNRNYLMSYEFYTFKIETPLDFKGFARLLLGRFISKDRIFYYDKFSSSVTESTIYISKFQ